METIIKLLPWIVGALVLVLLLAVLRRPVAWLFRLAGRSAVGLGVLFLLSKVGELIGVTLGVNIVNALVLGLLGAPGFGLLLMLQWVLR